MSHWPVAGFRNTCTSEDRRRLLHLSTLSQGSRLRSGGPHPSGRWGSGTAATATESPAIGAASDEGIVGTTAAPGVYLPIDPEGASYRGVTGELRVAEVCRGCPRGRLCREPPCPAPTEAQAPATADRSALFVFAWRTTTASAWRWSSF